MAVLGGEDRDARLGESFDLRRDDDAAATSEDADVAGALFAEQLDEVLEVLDVTALIGADGDGLDVLLDGCIDDLLHRAVVPEVDHLGALRLQDPPHDVDARVVAVEQARRRHHANRVLRRVQGVHGTYNSRTSN